MKIISIKEILKKTEYTRTGGSQEELSCAEYLMNYCKDLGADVHLETFPVQMATMKKAVLEANGEIVPCKGFFNCGSGEIEAPFLYLPNTDQASLNLVDGKIVLIDKGVTYFLYQDLVKNGAVGIITSDGNVNFHDHDIDQKELRGYVRADAKKILCANINAKDAYKLVKNEISRVKLTIEQEEYEGESRNVVAEIPGETDEWIALTAHYDSTSLSMGSYDNMTGCIGLLGVLEDMLENVPNRYGLRFIFCGSEERGLLGSKAYTEAHKDEMERCALCINLDMLGTYMGYFHACVSAEDNLVAYLKYHCSIHGWGLNIRQGIYSSDSTPFVDHGVPALSFARIADARFATIHNRYDTRDVVSPDQLKLDIDFVSDFTNRMANAVKCPVGRDLPDNVQKELDEYLNRRRKES